MYWFETFRCLPTCLSVTLSTDTMKRLVCVCVCVYSRESVWKYPLPPVCLWQLSYLAVLSSGCFVPTSFLTCIATLLSSSLSRHRRLMNEVGYPTIFSASDTTLLQFEGAVFENKLKFICPRWVTPIQESREQVARRADIGSMIFRRWDRLSEGRESRATKFPYSRSRSGISCVNRYEWLFTRRRTRMETK